MNKMRVYKNYIVGANSEIAVQATVGLKYAKACKPTVVGEGAIIRTGTIVYADVVIGRFFQTGHYVLIREHTIVGDFVLVGTHSILDGYVIVGDFVKIESSSYVPTNTRIGNRVFIGPNVTLTNDKYPLKMRNCYKPEGPIIEDNVSIGGGVTVVPGVRIGEGSFIAAGTTVTKDIPPFSFVHGVPGRIMPIPDKLREQNLALSWREHIDE